jgi:hypothetical protein
MWGYEKFLQYNNTACYITAKNKAAPLHYPNEKIRRHLISNIFEGKPPDQYHIEKP